MSDSPREHFFRFWLPVYLYAGVIFLFSSWAVPPQPPPLLHVDKLIHIAEYAILAYLLARAARNSSSARLSMHFRAFAVCVAALYGLSDEFHQYFVPGRGADGFDVLADAIGALIGQMCLRG